MATRGSVILDWLSEFGVLTNCLSPNLRLQDMLRDQTRHQNPITQKHTKRKDSKVGNCFLEIRICESGVFSQDTYLQSEKGGVTPEA
jgi:hypothetical protein